MEVTASAVTSDCVLNALSNLQLNYYVTYLYKVTKQYCEIQHIVL